MRKQKLMIAILFIVLLCSYFISHPNQHQKVCSLKQEKSTIAIIVNYDNDSIVNSLEVRFKQKFSEKSLSNMSEDEIVETLQTIFSQNGNENVQVKVTYNNEQRVAEVSLHIEMDHLSKEELDDYQLTSNMEINDFIKAMEKNKFKCEVIE